ncbi:DUF1330 domain-containing protein [Mycobacterium sp. B14F4]|uniref:DUF1330 domain-containing protein n=1 Tax=Mycobacterium sp. B14F4 TaxID=3153565 RepID=UPI00325DEF86
MTVYALTLLDIANRGEYLAYSKRSPQEVAKQADSKDALDGCCNDPDLADLHAHREDGSSSYIWHLFDRLDDLRPLLKPV